LITATNEPIYDRSQERSLSTRLALQINTGEIHLPPSATEINDVLIAEHFLNVYRKKYNPGSAGMGTPL
jgi:DNA-binding NtrC family response regulator